MFALQDKSTAMGKGMHLTSKAMTEQSMYNIHYRSKFLGHLG